jgi:hypothetical protein
MKFLRWLYSWLEDMWKDWRYLHDERAGMKEG